eukprot:m.134482 g.134482  ORF g.134482 m.134482 type:complete len:127 (+) comp9613_c0_seq1:86-466(+)
MSWQTYVDQSLVGSGKMTYAAIHGLDGNPWATSAGLSISPDEAKKIIAGFSNPSGFYATGLFAGKTKYLFIKGDDTTLIGKKEDTGISIYKTEKTIVIGIYGPGQQAGDCNNVVCNVGQYLKSLSY